MHELGLCEGVLDAVRRRADGRPVSRITVRAGVKHAVWPDNMEMAFQMVARGTEADGAGVDVIQVAAQVACDACGHVEETLDLLAVCPACQSPEVTIRFPPSVRVLVAWTCPVGPFTMLTCTS